MKSWQCWRDKGYMKAELTLPPELVNEIADKVIEKLLPYLSVNNDHGTEDKIFTVKQLSKYIGLSESWVYNNKHKIPHFNKKENEFKRKGKPLFRKSEIDEWLNTFRKEPESIPRTSSPGIFKQQKQRVTTSL